MKCDEVRRILGESAEGAETPQPEELVSHLTSCDKCRSFQTELTEAWRMLDIWQDIEPSADFRARFWQRVEAAENACFWNRMRQAWAQAALMKLTVAVVTVGLLITVGTMLVVRQLELRPGLPPQTAALDIPVASALANAEDDQLLQSLTQLTSTTPAASLEMYDIWQSDGDEAEAPISPRSPHLKSKKPAQKTEGISDESIG
jgi:hypothetical protein